MLLSCRRLFGLLLVLLVGCGGGASDDSGLVSLVTPPGTGSTLLLRLTDASGAIVTNNTLNLNSTAYTAQGQVRDSSGVAIPNQLVSFTTDPAYGSFVNGTTTVVATTSPTGTQTVSTISGLTDSAGLVKVQLVGKALGAAYLVASTKVASTTLTTSLPYQVTSVVSTVPSSLLFASATPAQMVISTASSGAKQSIVRFRVVNELGVGVSGQSVWMSLESQSIKAGVTFVKNGVSSSAPQIVTSELDGYAQIVVSAGALPTGIVVTASLVSNPTVTASSAGLSVTNGRISQGKMSVSAASPTVEGFDLDGATTELTVIASDRLGNPVPEGTVVNFVTSHGLIGTFVTSTTTSIVTNSTTNTATTVVTSIVTAANGSCTMSAASSCKVQLRSAGTRPLNGRVTVLAYADGEEAFIDLNGNNQWDQGEAFTDMGMAYLDMNGDGLYVVGVDQPISGGKTGSSTCTGTELSVQNTCDGTWSDFIRARQRYTVVWATSRARLTLVSRSLSQLNISVLDLNGNGMAAGTTVTAVVGNASACAVRRVAGGTDLGTYTVFLNGDASCASAPIEVTVTSPAGFQTFQVFP